MVHKSRISTPSTNNSFRALPLDNTIEIIYDNTGATRSMVTVVSFRCSTVRYYKYTNLQLHENMAFLEVFVSSQRGSRH